MVNLIGNTCIASWMTTKCYNQELINPFTWSILDFDSAYNLVKNYDKINFNYYELKKDKDWNFSITIDNQVTVQYVHYKFRRNATKLTKDGVDLYWNKIWEYIVNQYKKHIKKMLTYNIEPIFIFGSANKVTRERCLFNVEQQAKLDELNSKYTIVLSFKEMIEPRHVICIKQDGSYNCNGVGVSTEIYNKIKDVIK